MRLSPGATQADRDFVLAVAQVLREERIAQGKQWRALSRESGVSLSGLKRIETGSGSVALLTLASVCRALGVEMSTVVARAEALVL